MALDYSYSTFYVVQTAGAEFGVPADKKIFSTQNEA
jgi:hypothetical protein